jgi:hypothetical protein
MTQSVFATFAPHFAPSPAPVAQWIEQRFPKPFWLALDGIRRLLMPAFDCDLVLSGRWRT